MTTDLAALKQRLHPALADVAGGGPDGLEGRLRAIYSGDPAWRASRPMNEGRGIAALIETVWAPLMRAFPDLERRDSIFVAGRSIHAPDRPVRVAAMGHLGGTFREPWLGVPPNGQAVFLRYGEVHEMEGERHRAHDVADRRARPVPSGRSVADRAEPRRRDDVARPAVERRRAAG